MTDQVPIRRALISVSDKTDLIPFARVLARRGVQIVSTGGTARALAEAGIAVTAVSDMTGFPEIMDGRVKTLHPAVHGALLARRDQPQHVQAMTEHGIEPIDLVCINLYPFARTIRREDVTFEEAIENIDIGGPAMIRSAAKNHQFVTVVTSPDQYDRVANELDSHDGATTRQLRADLAAAAFSRTAEYDAMIAAWMNRRQVGTFPDQLRISFTKVSDLRYGENPHQQAALYRDPASRGPSIVNADLLHGKALSYNNVGDSAAALLLVREFSQSAAAVIKHANPCGAAVAESPADAFTAAYEGDPLAAFGGIVAFNRTVDEATARHVVDGQKFFEVVIAPAFEPAAREMLAQRWANVRLLAVGDHTPTTDRKIEIRSIPGGLLVQDQDRRKAQPETWQHAAGPAPDEALLADAAVVWTIAKHLKSNAIAIGGRGRLYGAGAGQMDRVASCRLAVGKAGERARGAIAASDAFFPFPDGPQVLIDAGVKCIVHPGGSKRDQETIDLCQKRGVTCLLTGVRHFRH
ncbi:MAG: bifunctional phosphoribosylaminoimidazolecarboxamide formyltransferase/IMP cyclohydrolase [Phycisphaerales bacterium]|nr:bifunctional phosphoribosylaminoimidazolecarboxamide formyltransferase/IMP cyclohydrolase [Phycisphaerales bacterium]